VELGPLNDLPPTRATGRRPRRIGRWILLAIVLGLGALLWSRRRAPDPTGAAAPREASAPRPSVPIGRVVPEGTRIRIEVLNGTDTRGLARQATFALRDAGFDVVYFGNSAERSDSSIVRDRSGHPDWAAWAAKALGGARITQQPDSGRLLDLTVLIGKHWSPAGLPLHP
jgi:hypothetical protein